MIFGKRENIALDWGSETLKWAKIEKIPPNRLRLAYLDAVSIPSVEELANTLKEYVLQKGLKGMGVAMSFYDESCTIRRMELPEMPEEDLKEGVRWQMRDIAEGSIDDYITSYSVLNKRSDVQSVQLTLLGYAIKRGIVEEYQSLLESAGLKPYFMEPSPVGLAAVVDRIYPTQQEGWIGGIDLGSSHSTFFVIGNRKLHYVQPMTRTKADEAELPPEAITALTLEIQQAMDTFTVSYRVDKLDCLILSGGGANHQALTHSLSKNLGIPTEILNPFHNIEQASAFELANEKPQLFGGAVGLALLAS